MAVRVQERRHHLPVRGRAEEVARSHVPYEKPPPEGGGFVLGNVPLRSQRTNRFGNRNRIVQEICVNAVASIASAPMFRLSSCFVLKERIDPRIASESRRKIFR